MSTGDDARTRILRRKKVAQAMEAAFDNELDTFRRIVEEPTDGISVPLEPEREREDSFLGEAACGNAVDVVEYLIGKNVNVNTVGAQNRTPLARACFNNAIEVIPTLLAAGADPRLLLPQERDPETGEVVFREWDPAEARGLGVSEAIMDILRAWPIERTLTLLKQSAVKRADAVADAQAQEVAKHEKLEENAASLRNLLVETQKALSDAVARREERIHTYDMCKCERRDNVDFAMLDSLIKESMRDVDQLKIRCDEIELRLKKAQAEVRTHAIELQGGMTFDMQSSLDQLEDVALHDVGGTIARSGKKARLIVDPAGTALTLLTYKSCTLVDIGNSHHMCAEQIVLNVLGCLRHGKPFVINIRDKELADALVTLRAKFDAVSRGLLDDVLSHAISDPAKYLHLVTDEIEAAHPSLTRKSFSPTFTEKFVCALITSQQYPDEAAAKQFYTVKLN